MNKKMQWWERPDLMYDGNELAFGGRSAAELAGKYSTPLYVYNGNRIIENYSRIKKALESGERKTRVAYAVKALPRAAVLSLLKDVGCAYLDAVSPAEALAGIRAGYDPKKIMFTGTNMSNDDLQFALRHEILINIDSESQLRRLHGMHYGPVDISVRWNPGIGAGAYSGTITAGAESHGRPVKFGIAEEQMPHACSLARLMDKRIIGLHQHIGSNWKGDAVEDFLETVGSTLDMAASIGKLEFVDLGGGPGIRYREDEKEFPLGRYANGIWNHANTHDAVFDALMVEPGRYIVGDAGILLLEVNTVEQKNGNLLIGVNGGFNSLIRPVMYGEEHDGIFRECYHEILPCSRTGRIERATVAGNLCETGDLFAIKREMEIPEEGGYIAILNGGAYGASMASNYNSRPLPAELMLVDSKEQLIRKLQEPEEIVV